MNIQELRNKRFLDLSSDFAVEFASDEEGHFRATWMTKGFTDVTGYALEELQDEGAFIKLIHPEDSSKFTRMIREVISQDSATTTIRIVCKNYTHRVLRLRSCLLIDPENQRDRRVFSTGTDLTEILEMESVVSDKEASLNARVNELSCLLALSKLTVDKEIDIEKLLQGAIRLLPDGFSRPDTISIEMQWQGQTYTSASFRKSPLRLGETIRLRGDYILDITVYKQLENNTDAVTPDERTLLKGAADILKSALSRKLSTLQIEENEQRQTAFLESSRDAIYYLRNGHFEYVNPAFQRMFEISLKECQKPDFDMMVLIAPESHELIKERSKRRSEGDPTLEPRYEFIGLSRSGKRIELDASLTEIEDSKGKLVIGLLHDITASKRLVQTQSWMLQALEAAPVAVILTGVDGKIRWVNHRFRDLFGYKIEEVRNRQAIDYFEMEDTDFAGFKNWVEILNKTGGKYDGALVGREKEGPGIQMFWAVQNVVDENGNTLGIAMAGLDERRLNILEKQRRKLERELSRQFHLSQVGLLTSGITHNIRNPLSVIMMNTSMALIKAEKVMADHPDDPVALYDGIDGLIRSLTKIDEGASRLEQIVSEVMAYHQMNVQLNSDTCDLNEVLKTDVDLLKADLDIKHKVKLTVDLCPGMLPVSMKPSDIAQIFLNLTSNARDALMDSENRQMFLRSGKVEEHNIAWFEVRDTGPGIPEEIREKLGEPFITTKANDEGAKRRGSGTGLGIYMIRQILAQHGGRMEVNSKPGDTSFRIFIPTVQADELHTEEGEE